MKELGVTALGDRKKLLSIIAKLKKEPSVTSSESSASSTLATPMPPGQPPRLNGCDDTAPGHSHLASSIVETHQHRSYCRGTSTGISDSEDECDLLGGNGDDSRKNESVTVSSQLST